MTSDSVVVIPTFKRPEYLALCLERIAQTGYAESLDVRIFLDWGISGRLEEVEYVRDTYLPVADIFEAQPHVKVLSGTYNILRSLREGYETGKSFVFFIEEDIMISPSFFDWHWSTQESGDYFVTCGRKHFHMPEDFYSNPGTCYRREKLALVIPHINDDYFSNTEKYVDTMFPQYKGMDGSLDDGLIRKVQRGVAGKAKCAIPPVAFHQGFRHYNRTEGFLNQENTIQRKIERLREILGQVNPLYKITADFEPFVEAP